MSSSRHCLSLHVSFQALDGVTGQTQEPKSRELVQPPAICQGQIRDWIRLKPLTAFPSVLLLVHLSRRFGGSCHGASLRFAGYTAARPVHARVGQSVELPRVPSSVSAAAPGHTPAPPEQQRLPSPVGLLLLPAHGASRDPALRAGPAFRPACRCHNLCSKPRDCQASARKSCLGIRLSAGPL